MLSSLLPLWRCRCCRGGGGGEGAVTKASNRESRPAPTVSVSSRIQARRLVLSPSVCFDALVILDRVLARLL